MAILTFLEGSLVLRYLEEVEGKRDDGVFYLSILEESGGCTDGECQGGLNGIAVSVTSVGFNLLKC